MTLRCLCLAFSLAFVTASQAATIPPVGTYSLPSIAAMKNQNLLSKTSLQIDSYYGDGRGGGGKFKYSADVCTDNGGTVQKDGAGNCFLLQGWDGDLRNFGVTTGSAYDWNTNGLSSTDITPVLTAAGIALNGISSKVIHTNGVSVYMRTSYTQPGRTTFTCDQTIGVPAAGSWFDTLKGAVYEAHGVIWNRANRISSVHHCFIAPDFLIAGVPTDAHTNSTLLSTMISNGDTGLVCDARGCNDHDLFIVGFDTGYEASSSGENRLTDVYIDANVCEWITGAGSNPSWRNVNCFTYLTQAAANKEEDFSITKIENDGGLCKLTVIPDTSSSQPGILADLIYANYMYTTSITSTSAGCEGQWKLSSINAGAGTFDLVGSAVVGPTTFGHWAAGSNVIYVTDGTNIANDNVINGLDAQGIPTGTTVVTAWPLPPITEGYLTDTGGAANAYVANAVSGMEPCRLADVLNVAFTAAHTNTAASTLNITLNSSSGCTGGTTGTIAIVHQDGTALIANDIVSGAHVQVRYSSNLSKWILLQPKVVLSVPTTLAQATNHTITFVNAVCSSCGAAPKAIFLFTARVDAGGSAGGVAAGGTGWATGTLVGGPSPKEVDASNRVAGFQADQLFDYDHSIELHIMNSNETGVTNFGTDSHGNDDNPNTIILLVDEESNNAHVVGRKAGKGGRSILVNVTYPNSPDRGCVTWTSASVASTTSFLPIADVEQGCLRMNNGVTTTTGVNLVSNFANQARFDVYQPNSTIYYEGDAAVAATCTVGSSLGGGDTCGTLGVTGPTGRARRVNITADTTATASNCNSYYNNTSGGNLRLTLPAAPPGGCTFTFTSALGKMFVIFSGTGMALPGWANDPITTFVVCCSGLQDSFIQITWDGTKWSPTAYSRALYDLITPRDASVIRHGQVYLTHNSGSSRFELAPQNGPGGIITNGHLMQVADAGLYLPDAGDTSSSLNYLYAYSNTDSDGVVSGAGDHGGLIQLTITHSETTGSQVTMVCFSIGGSYQANGAWSGSVIDGTHIDLLSSSSTNLGTYTSGGQCRLLSLKASTTVPVVIGNGVQSKTGDAHYTLVGKADVGASHAVNSTFSFFNFPPSYTGLLNPFTAPVSTGAGTAEQTLGTFDLPASWLTAGKNLRIQACFRHANNANTVTSRLYFGATFATDSGNTNTLLGVCENIYVLSTGSSTQSIAIFGNKGTTVFGPAPVAGTETDTSPITIKATAQDGTNSAGDGTLTNFTIEALN